MTFRVRRAVPGDEGTLRDLRVQALTDAPAAFCSTLDRELARTHADWQGWLSPGATFLLEHELAAKGLACGVPDASDPGLAYLMAMWVHPALRGSGAADQLVEAVLAWAMTVRATTIRLNVIQGNEAARRLYARHGFRETGHTTAPARNGAIEVQMERP